MDPARFVLEATSEVFSMDKRSEMSNKGNDLGLACDLVLESLISVVSNPKIEKSRRLQRLGRPAWSSKVGLRM